MINISVFNEFGLQIFREHIESKGLRELPKDILIDEQYSQVISNDIFLDESKSFEDRLMMAKYLDETVSANIFDSFDNKPEFWSWICCLYREQIIQNGKFSKPEHYIYMPGRVVYRHSVATPVRLYRQHGHDISRMLISNKMHVWGELAEQINGRQYLTRSKKLLNFICNLYYDRNKDSLKPSTGSKISSKLLKNGERSRAGEGGARRVALQLKRLSLNYKVDAMDVTSINSLLPSEYEKFISNN